MKNKHKEWHPAAKPLKKWQFADLRIYISFADLKLPQKKVFSFQK
jgi:hypothetical protein